MKFNYTYSVTLSDSLRGLFNIALNGVGLKPVVRLKIYKDKFYNLKKDIMDTEEALKIFRKKGNANKMFRQMSLEKQTDQEAKSALFEEFGLDEVTDDELFWEFRLDTPSISQEEADEICRGWLSKVEAADSVISANSELTKQLQNQLSSLDNSIKTEKHPTPNNKNNPTAKLVNTSKENKHISLSKEWLLRFGVIALFIYLSVIGAGWIVENLIK